MFFSIPKLRTSHKSAQEVRKNMRKSGVSVLYKPLIIKHLVPKHYQFKNFAAKSAQKQVVRNNISTQQIRKKGSETICQPNFRVDKLFHYLF